MKIPDYSYRNARPAHTSHYLWRRLGQILAALPTSRRHVFEIGCGNGALGRWLAEQGYRVTGIDPSESGVSEAKAQAPDGNEYYVRSVSDDLAVEFGTFPILVSLEVIEHCYSPAAFMKAAANLLEPEGVLVISTPYHGYVKNLLLALFNQFDSHWSPEWEGGHIKFWSVASLTRFLEEYGFEVLAVHRLGRIPVLAKSMMLVAKKRAA